MAVDAIWNLSKFTGSTGKFLYSNFLESRSVLVAKFSSAYNTSTGASKYIKVVKNHYPLNFQNFPKLCITFKRCIKVIQNILWSGPHYTKLLLIASNIPGNCHKLQKSWQLTDWEKNCPRNLALVTENMFYETGPRFICLKETNLWPYFHHLVHEILRFFLRCIKTCPNLNVVKLKK